MKGKTRRLTILLFAFVVMSLLSTTALGASPAMNKKSAVIYYPGSTTLKVKNLGKVKVKSWKSSNKTVATVTSSGKVTAKKKGKATITATLSNGKKCACAVTVKYRLVKSVTMDASRTIYVGKTATLKPTIAPSNASIKKLKWKSTNKAVATVNSSGKVTGVKAGKATISATTTDGSKKTAKCVVTVSKPAVKVTSVTLNKSTYVVRSGSTTTATATVAPSNATNKSLTWKTSNGAVASVNSSGKITGGMPGTATITAAATDGSGKKASATVKVEAGSTNDEEEHAEEDGMLHAASEEDVPVSSVVLNTGSATVYVGDTYKLSATISPSYATNQGLTWTSSDATVATVTSSGSVKGIKAGTATIKATAKDGSGKYGTCLVTVANSVKITSVTFATTSYRLASGDAVKIGTTITPSNATNKGLTWTTSNSNVATVDANGNVRGVKEGTATIKATAKDGSGKYAQATVNVWVRVSSVMIDYPEYSVMEGSSVKLTTTILPANATTRTLTWKSSNTAVATVDSTGKVTGTGVGTATVTATATDGSGKSSFATIKVREDTLKPVRQGLANAKAQGPEAFIRFCETSQYASKINIGQYGARYLVGCCIYDSDAINAEADFGAALNALYTPWLKSIYEKSWASKTDVPLYKMVFLTGYVSVMHKRHMTYCNRTYGWCLCPTIAPLLRDGITTNIGTGYLTSQSYMGGNCAADADLLMHLANYMGLSNAWCEGENGAYSHWATYVKIGSDTYMFDVTNNRARKLVNGQLVAMTQDVWDEDERLENIYGVQPYTP